MSFKLQRRLEIIEYWFGLLFALASLGMSVSAIFDVIDGGRKVTNFKMPVWLLMAMMASLVATYWCFTADFIAGDGTAIPYFGNTFAFAIFLSLAILDAGLVFITSITPFKMLARKHGW